MDEKQYLKMRAKADEEYRKNLEAIDRVWHMSHPDKMPPIPPAAQSGGVSKLEQILTGGAETAPANGGRPFMLSEAVKQIIAELPEKTEISQPLVLSKLLTRYPQLKPRIQKDQIKAQIAGTLSRMVKSEDLTRIREPHGSEPALFKKIPVITNGPTLYSN